MALPGELSEPPRKMQTAEGQGCGGDPVRAAAAAEAMLGGLPWRANAVAGASAAAVRAGAAGGSVAPCTDQSSPATLRRADIHLEQAGQLLRKAMSDLGEDSRKAQEQYAEKEAALKQQLAAAEAARDEANQKNAELTQQLTQAETVRTATSAIARSYHSKYQQVCLEKTEVLQREVQQKEQLQKEKAEAVQREQAMQKEKMQAVQQVQALVKEKAEAVQREQAMQRQLDEEVLCQICMEHKRDTVLMPCMHFLYCHGCIQGQTARAGAAAAAAAGGGGGGAVAAAGGAGGSRGQQQQQQRGGRGGAAAVAPAPLLPCPACRVPITGHIVALLASR